MFLDDWGFHVLKKQAKMLIFSPQIGEQRQALKYGALSFYIYFLGGGAGGPPPPPPITHVFIATHVTPSGVSVIQ